MNNAQELGRRVARLEKILEGLLTPQLSSSTIEGGALKLRDGEQLVGAVGRQYDGTFGASTLAGPTPPTPRWTEKWGPSAEWMSLGLKVRWEGYFEPDDTTVAPMDYSHVEVHVSSDPNLSGLLFDTLKATITSARGGEVFLRLPVLASGGYYLRLITRSNAGKVSAASTVVGPISSSGIPQGDLGFNISDLSGNTIFYGPATPTAKGYGDLWLKQVGTDSSGNPLYSTFQWQPGSPDSWVQLADSGASAALASAIAAQQAADSKAKVFTQPDEPTWTGAAGTAIWIDSDNGNVTYTWDGTDFVIRQLGTGAFQPNSIVASDVFATGTVTAALLEAIMVLTNVVIVGNPDGAHAELRSTGLFTYDVGPDGQIIQTGSFGAGSDGFTSVDPTTGESTMAFIQGEGSLQTLSVAGRDFDGDGIPDAGLTVYGRDFADWIADFAGGGNASAFYANAANGLFASGIATRFGLGEISFTQGPGRQYLVVCNGLHVASTVAGDRALLSVRFTTDGSTPTISNGTVLDSSIVHCATANQAYSGRPIIGFGSFPAGATVRLLATVERLSGTGTISVLTYTTTDAFSAPFRFFTADMGRDIPDTYIPNDGGGVRTGGTPSATPKKTYTSSWTASFVGTYRGDGTRRTDTTDMVEGYTSYYPPNGTQKSIAGFLGTATQGEVGKTVAQALAGSSISKVEIALRCNHSDSMAGGTARIGYHGNTSLPATAPSATYEALGNAFFKRGETRWITLPSSTWASWLNGTYRGITVGPGGDYMRFDGSGGTRPALRITYTR